MVQKKLATVVRLWAQVSEPGTQAFVMRVQIDMAVDAGHARVTGLEEFTHLFCVSPCNNVGSVPIEAMVQLKGGTKLSHTDAAPTNFLAGLESVLLTSAVPEDMRADIRSCATSPLRQKEHHQVLPIDEEKGLISLKTADSIVIVSADKGGATVLMEKTDYINKANKVFNEREAYTPLAEDPTEKQDASVKRKITELA
ncbi:unnamed protein product [Schistocephalus solidus]|uniref:CPSF73-100_C domain-containing protein n=1 Tax=Schistocephalus solidus TaxID=70667 RepID=A0A183TFN8_SCHSO|nr:unnamed protein product [Schistocephalus solidus]